MPADDDDLPDEQPKAKKGKAPEPKKKPAPALVEEPEPTPPKKQVHTQRLVAIATEMGFSQSDLDNHDSATIWEEVHRIQAMIAEQNKAKAAPEPKAAEPVDEEEEYLKSLETNSEVDPKHAKFLRRLKEKADKADAKDVRDKLAGIEEKEKQRETRSANESVDAAFVALGKRFEPLVGVDAMAELTDPGQKGWRSAIFQKAKIDFAKDSQRTINKKVAEAAASLAAGKVEDEDDTADEYEVAKPRKKLPPQDPETGRFTAEDFEKGHVAKPSGKKNGYDQLSAVEATRQYLRANGDPRGFRPALETEDDLPG